MKVTRRTFVVGGLGSLAATSFPTLAHAAHPALVVADPALLIGTVPFGTITGTGSQLLASLLPLVGTWHRIEAVLGDADMEMLAQLVRFQPGLRWSCERVDSGFVSSAGTVRRPARFAIATSDTLPRMQA